MTDSSARSIAYGRALLELRLLPEDRVRALGRHCLEQNLDLRHELLSRGLLTPAQDAQAVARAMGQTAAAPSREASAPGSAGDTRADLLPAGARVPAAGELFAGYRVEREIGRGGMGAVLAATAPDGAQVAIKVVLGELDAARRERFRREAEIGQGLGHPGIARVFSHGEADGVAYLVAELLVGARELDAYVAEEQVSLPDRLRLLGEVAEAVAAAHGAGIVHRDLKPDNVLITPEGQPKVLDFGLARVIDRERLTQSGAVMGTVHYMAPEQVRGDTAHADARADVFALGVMLYELVAGERPFQGGTSVEVMNQILSRDPEPLDRRVGGLPGGVAEVAGMALAKDPQQRYPDARAFARDLLAAVEGSGASDAAVALRRRGRRRPLVAGGVALAALAAAGAWWAGREPVLDRAALEREARAIAREAKAQLEAAAPLAEDAAAIAALGFRQAALSHAGQASAAAGVSVPEDALGRAAARARALVGLLALSRGDDQGARAALAATDPSTPAGSALAGALAALDPAADADAARAALDRAVSRGMVRHELIAWRVHAAVRAGLATQTDAERALAELDALAAARAPPDAERALRIRALIALGRAEDARTELGEIAAPSDELRWRVALARASLLIVPQPVAALEALAGLAPPAGLEAERAAVAAAAAERGAAILAAAPPGAPPKGLVELLRLARAAAPERPLPPELVGAVLERTCGMTAAQDVPLALALAEACPDEFVVQREVGALAQRGNITFKARRTLLPAFRRAVELAPSEQERLALQVGLCLVLAPLGSSEECVALASEILPALDEAPDRATVLGSRAHALQGLGRYEEALVDIEDAARQVDLGAIFKPRRATLLMALGRKQEALSEAVYYHDNLANAGLQGSSHMTTLIWRLTRESGDEATALRVLERHVGWFREDTEWWLRLAWARAHAGDAAGAARALETALPRMTAGLAIERILPLQPDVAAALELLAADPKRATVALRDLVREVDDLAGIPQPE